MPLLQNKLFLFSLFILIAINSSAQGWKKALDKKGIQVYTKAGKHRIDDTRTVMETSGSIEKVVDALFNFNQYPKWVPYCTKNTIIKKISDSEFVYHALLEIPYVKNRDLVIHIKKRTIHSGLVILELQNDNSVAPIANFIRMPDYYGRYTIIAKNKGFVYVELESSYDPGGSVPTFIINMGLTNSPYNMFFNLKNLIQ